MDGLLSNVYSFGDTLKRRLKGLLSDPVHQVKANVNAWAGDTLQAMQTPEGMTAGLLGMAPIGMAGQIVYHGSPHRFTKFDASKIGTGEGAQAYGHGIYVAEAPEVARGYQDRLSQVSYDDDKIARVVKYGKTNPRRVDMNAPSKDLSPADLALTYLNMYRKSPFEASMAIEDMIAANTVDKAKYVDALRILRSGKIDPRKIGEEYGNLYKVDLPDEAIAKMLDWDKPLSQQAPEVQAAIKQQPWIVNELLTDRFGSTITGGEFIKKHSGGPNRTSSAWVTDQLRQSGIPGIRYLDGGSRGAGQGTSNFVVFPGNEDLLKILEINGVPLKGLLAQ